MINLEQIAVISKDDLQEWINDGSCTSIEDLDFDLVQEYDYAQTALVDVDKRHIIYWNDNIHSNPDAFIEAFTSALTHTGQEYNIDKYCMLDKDLLAKNYSGDKY